jgi:carboxylesterase type B
VPINPPPRPLRAPAFHKAIPASGHCDRARREGIRHEQDQRGRRFALRHRAKHAQGLDKARALATQTRIDSQPDQSLAREQVEVFLRKAWGTVVILGPFGKLRGERGQAASERSG